MSETQEKVSQTTEGWRAVASDDLEGYSIVDSRGTVVAECVPSKELADLIASAPDLTKFKAYVHKRLDDAGIPADPESPHKAEGCRIGGRLDIVLAQASVTPDLLAACKMARDAQVLSADDYERKYYPLAGPLCLKDTLDKAIARATGANETT